MVAAELRDQKVGLVVRERVEPDDSVPARPALEQVRPRHADEKQRHASRKGRNLLDEIEEGVLAPVHVVENAHERALGRGRLEQLTHGPRDLFGRALLVIGDQATQCGERV